MRTQYKAKAINTGQNDNIIRDGVLTTKQAYDMFERAGMTTKEWLTKTYGAVKQPNQEEMEIIERTIRKYEDKTDIQDDINQISKKLELNKLKKEELLKERKQIEENLLKETNKSTQSIDK